MTDISRRKLFGAAGAASLGLAGMVPVASASECGKPVKWNETKEFVIIGTGFAGLAAALEAHQGGMKSDQILILEKMSFPGGNSVINGGAVAAAGTDMQKAEGIKDSPDLLYADIIKAGGGLAHPELARHIADESVENFYWLRDKIGVKFKAVTYHGGHSVKRSHAVESNSGAGFILPMLERLKEVGIKPQLRTKVEQLIVNDKGCVEGVKARTGYTFGKEESGKVVHIRATKGVLRHRRLLAECQDAHVPRPAPHRCLHLDQPARRNRRNDSAGSGNRRQHDSDGLDSARPVDVA